MKTYVITRLLEKEYGCEGIPDGKELETEVYFKGSDGQIQHTDINDRELVDKNINEGDIVSFSASGEIIKSV